MGGVFVAKCGMLATAFVISGATADSLLVAVVVTYLSI